MDLIVTPFAEPVGDAAPVEIVERKGLGHPDTICDALAEELSIALGRFYRERCGVILHHNVDKALLWGGASRPAFGGGEVLEPIEIFLAGRAVLAFDGVRVPIEDLVVETARTWLRGNLRHLDADRHVKIHSLVRAGSTELVGLFERGHREQVVRANDTSCGVGFAPASTLERTVLAVEGHLTSDALRARLPHVGEDVKVMGVRNGAAIALTVGCAHVDRHVRSLADYREKRAALADLIRAHAQGVAGRDVRVDVNAADDLERGLVFLTVTGTSAESGDDGEAGRGNRVGGLITPYRPMTMESAAGKNPISHVGKLYNVLARQVAEAAVRELPDLAAAECYLVSQIGRPIADPQLVQVRVAPRPGADVGALRPQLMKLVRDHLERADELWLQILERAFRLF